MSGRKRRHVHTVLTSDSESVSFLTESHPLQHVQQHSLNPLISNLCFPSFSLPSPPGPVDDVTQSVSSIDTLPTSTSTSTDSTPQTHSLLP